MRVLIGIDTDGAWQTALDLVGRLWSEPVEAHLLHCVESVLPDGSFPELAAIHPITTIYDDLKSRGESALKLAEAAAQEKGYTPATHLAWGDPARVLIEYADANECDLIVVRSSIKGFWESTMYGSTAKGVLAGAKQSVLVVKTNHPKTGPVVALLATDHSKYMDFCIDELLSLAPTGISELTVYTANEIDSGVAALLVRGLPSLAHESPIWIQEKLVELNQAVAQTLDPVCVLSKVVVDADNPHIGIKRAMTDSQAELLIMGAQGHGFFERLRLGSKSHHQALSEPYSVLVLRS
ncbi:MAG: universal stress protein [Fimbriimonadaceae bacterium]